MVFYGQISHYVKVRLICLYPVFLCFYVWIQVGRQVLAWVSHTATKLNYPLRYVLLPVNVCTTRQVNKRAVKLVEAGAWGQTIEKE